MVVIKRGSCSVVLTVALSMGLSGCFGVEKTNEHLASMDASTKQMTTSTAAMSESTAQLSKNFAADQEHIRAAIDQMAQMNKHMEVMEKELVADREYLKSLTESLKSLATSAESLRVLGDTAFSALTKAFLNPVGNLKIPGVDDISETASNTVSSVLGQVTKPLEGVVSTILGADHQAKQDSLAEDDDQRRQEPREELKAQTSGQKGSAHIADHKCVNGKLDQVIERMTQYDKYSTIPEADYRKGSGIFSISLLKMIKSVSVQRGKGNHDDNFVFVALQPFGVTDAKLLPSFGIRCRVERAIGGKSARHSCHRFTKDDRREFPADAKVLDTYPTFVISEFDSETEIVQGGNGCKPDQISLDYTVSMKTDPNQVEQLLKGMGNIPMPPEYRADPVQAIFTEYYVNFYNGWIRHVESGK